MEIQAVAGNSKSLGKLCQRLDGTRSRLIHPLPQYYGCTARSFTVHSCTAAKGARERFSTLRSALSENGETREDSSVQLFRGLAGELFGMTAQDRSTIAVFG